MPDESQKAAQPLASQKDTKSELERKLECIESVFVYGPYDAGGGRYFFEIHFGNHFMGSVILKQQETPSSYKTGDVRSIVDGQQRLTTITLFFKALFLKNEIPDKFREIFQTYDGELILIHNYLNKKVF